MMKHKACSWLMSAAALIVSCDSSDQTTPKRSPSHAPLILSAVAEPASVCEGESTTISVRAEHPDDPSLDVDVSIYGSPASRRVIQVPPVAEEGSWYVDVAATTPDSLHDSRLVSVEVRKCPAARLHPLLAAMPNPYEPGLVDLVVLNAAELGSVLNFDWSLGDGTTTSTPYPHLAHDYFSHLEPTEVSRNFDVRVTAHLADGTESDGARTITITNDYAILRALGHIQLPVEGPSELTVSDHPATGHVALTVRNREPTSVALTERRVRVHPCDHDLEPTDTIDAVSLVVPGNGSLPVTAAIAGTSELWAQRICSVSVHFSGRTLEDDLEAQAHSYLLVSPPDHDDDRYKPVTDPALLGLLNSVVDSGLTARPDRVSESELHRLGLERRAPLYSSGSTQVLGPEIGERCTPDEAPPRPGVTCQATADFDFREPYIANALKGDAVLTTGCGVVYEILSNVSPPQHWTHSGMMTKNYTELRNATGVEAYMEQFPVGLLGQPLDGFEAHAVQHLWPGTITQSVKNSFFGEMIYESETEREYRLAPFSHSPAACSVSDLLSGNPAIIFPQVVRPPLSAGAEHRARLHAAADHFQNDVHGHYRFFGYTDAASAAGLRVDEDSDVEWSRGTRGLVCSSAVWFALRGQDFAFEGPLEERDKASEIGAQIDDQTIDGLYFYDEREREHAGQHLWATIRNNVFAKNSNAWIGSAATDIANQVVSCFGRDDCGPGQRQNGYSEPGVGRAVSPDNILLWDGPGSGGPYGEAERMAFVQADYRRVLRWAAAGNAGSVDVLVTYRGTPVESATVDLLGPPQVTDEAGITSFAAVPSGQYEVSAHATLDNGVHVRGQEIVVVAPGQVTPIEVQLQPPPPDTFRVTVTGRLDITDNDALRDDHGSLTISETFDISAEHPTFTISEQACVDDEVLVEVSIFAHRVDVSDVRQVRFDYNIQAYEWSSCSPRPSERFGVAENHFILFFDDIDSSQPGPTEQFVLPVDWVNNVDPRGGDTVRGGLAFSIEAPP